MTHVLASLTHRIRSSCIEFVPCDTQQHGSRWLWRRFSLCFPFGRVGLVELERSMLVVHASGTCLACTVALVCPHPWPYGFSGGTMFSDRSRVCDAMYHDQGLLVGRRSSPLVAELGCMPPALSRPDTFGCFTDRRDERADANGTLRDASRLVQCNALCFVVGPLVSYADVQVTTTRFGGLFPVGYIQCVVNADTDAATVLP